MEAKAERNRERERERAREGKKRFSMNKQHILFIINRIVGEHFTIFSIDCIIRMLDFNDAT